MAGELARTWDLAWKPADGELPDAAAELWIAVFGADGEFMGAAPSGTTAWVWRGGRLCLHYGAVRVTVTRGGRYKTGVICAVVPSARAYRPMWPVSLGEPGFLRAGDDITIIGVIEVSPADEHRILA